MPIARTHDEDLLQSVASLTVVRDGQNLDCYDPSKLPEGVDYQPYLKDEGNGSVVYTRQTAGPVLAPGRLTPPPPPLPLPVPTPPLLLSAEDEEDFLSFLADSINLRTARNLEWQGIQRSGSETSHHTSDTEESDLPTSSSVYSDNEEIYPRRTVAAIEQQVTATIPTPTSPSRPSNLHISTSSAMHLLAPPPPPEFLLLMQNNRALLQQRCRRRHLPDPPLSWPLSNAPFPLCTPNLIPRQAANRATPTRSRTDSWLRDRRRYPASPSASTNVTFPARVEEVWWNGMEYGEAMAVYWGIVKAEGRSTGVWGVGGARGRGGVDGAALMGGFWWIGCAIF